MDCRVMGESQKHRLVISPKHSQILKFTSGKPISQIHMTLQVVNLQAKEMACFVLPLLLLAICHSSAHGEVPATSNPTTVTKPLSNEANEFLKPHNQARAAVRVGPLKWSEMLANAASRLVRYQKNKMGCGFANLTNSKYGGNQLWARGMGFTPRMAVDRWVQEKNYYNHADNSCAPNHRCGVYTQVVWKNSLELGCAQATCVKEKASLTICFYNPPGNIIGKSPY